MGEAVELAFGEASNITVDSDEYQEGDTWELHRLTVANANPFPILYEARFRDDRSARFDAFDGKLIRVDGRWVWRITIPANSKAALTYRETELED
jgi:hypothetical protein